MASKGRLQEFFSVVSQDLNRTMQFWLKHSQDEQFGGFFNCLGKDGKVYDELKYGWLQCRQVWMYAKLYNEVERFKTPDILKVAEKGATFVMNHIIQKTEETWRCYFCVTRDGKPVHRQRKLFTECFYTMAMTEMARATGNTIYRTEAVGMMNEIMYWVQVDDSSLEAPVFPGRPKANTMAVPMMVLCCLHELMVLDPKLEEEYRGLLDYCLEKTLEHVQRDGEMILEEVSEDGQELPGCLGRKTVPGHAIECGWFLLREARRRSDKSLKKLAIEKFILKPMSYGWDEKYDGLFYYLDADGLSPTQLEWDMKLWWPHNEAMIACLMAYQDTEDVAHLDAFARVFDYSYKHFVDKEHGEWIGYLSRQGDVSMDFKGGPYKGCFHVPRCLMMCEQMLKEIIAREEAK